MAMCSGCGGTGRRIWEGANGPYNERCNICNGTGLSQDAGVSTGPGGSYRSTSRRKNNVGQLADAIGLAVGCAIFYLGVIQLQLEWYWPAGAALIVGFVVSKALSGPVRPIQVLGGMAYQDSKSGVFHRGITIIGCTVFQ